MYFFYFLYKESLSDSNTLHPVGIRRPYIRIVGLEVDSSGPGRSLNKYTPEEEDEFKK